VVVSLKIFLQVLLGILVLGLGAPQTVCAAGTSDAGKTSCCSEVSPCPCPT